MKKYFLIIFAALISLGASAQKGEQNIGAHVLFGTDMSNFGIGAKYQYNVTNAIRLEGVADYYLKLADKIFPVLEVDAGRDVDIVITQSASIVTEKSFF